VQELDFLSDRVVSLAFDVISHVLETGPVSNLYLLANSLISITFYFSFILLTSRT
jgi:hypothetical protein